MSAFLLAKDPTVAFYVGSIAVKWYGLIIVLAMLLALVYVCFQIKKINLSSDDGVELFLWIIPLAIIFARVFYVFPGRIDEYFPIHSFEDFKHLIAIWEGGITIIGGLIGGVLGGIFFVLRHRKQTTFASVADLVVVPLLAGQIIGRLGNFINQEAFGLPILNPKFQTFPFGVYITNPSGVEEEFFDKVYSNVPGWFCATFFYEMVWNFLGLVAAAVFWHKGENKKYPGLMIIFYFFWYALGRFWLEFLRMDAVPVTKVACGVIAPIALVIGVLYVLYRISLRSYKYVSGILKNSLSDEDGDENIVDLNKLKGAALSDFDVDNYNFASRLFEVKLKKDKKTGATKEVKNPLRLIYAKDGHIFVNFDEADYYHAPTFTSGMLRFLKKTAEFKIK